MNSLYIFMTSDRPDQYINIIVHCVSYYGINNIVLVQIDRQEGKQVQAEILRQNINQLLHDLTLGLYKHYTGSKKDQEVNLNDYYKDDEIKKIKDLYLDLIGNFILNDQKINETDLQYFLVSLSKGNSKEKTLIDISCVSKRYIGDILSCCLLQNMRKVYTFDLLKEPNYINPWESLIHNLKEGEEYNYINVLETHIVKQIIQKITFRTTRLYILIIITLLLVAITLILNFLFGNNTPSIQTINIIGTILTIVSFFVILFPIRDG